MAIFVLMLPFIALSLLLSINRFVGFYCCHRHVLGRLDQDSSIGRRKEMVGCQGHHYRSHGRIAGDHEPIGTLVYAASRSLGGPGQASQIATLRYFGRRRCQGCGTHSQIHTRSYRCLGGLCQVTVIISKSF